MKGKAMDKSTIWATYWAALVHDYEHGGLNNDFLIKTAHVSRIISARRSWHVLWKTALECHACRMIES